MSLHKNDGKCPHCAKIFDRYPKFYWPLRSWFESFQRQHKEAHISCAGRGRIEQEDAYLRRASRSRFGESAHNFNAAIDIFEISGDLKNLYEVKFYYEKLLPSLPEWVTWYGEDHAQYKELPHVQVKNWKQLVKDGELTIVET